MPSTTLAKTQRRIAANVRKWRLQRGLTQEALIELTGLDRRHLQRIERGQENITLASLVGLANALEVTPSMLFRPAELAPAKRGRPPKKRAGVRKA